jgi:hypothetical protein
VSRFVEQAPGIPHDLNDFGTTAKLFVSSNIHELVSDKRERGELMEGTKLLRIRVSSNFPMNIFLV